MFQMLLIMVILHCFVDVEPKNITLNTIAYDCGVRPHNDLNIASYSLLETENCDVNKRNVSVTTIEGQIVQKAKIKNIMVQQCKIKLHRIIHKCSFWGYLEPVENGIQEYLIDVSREQCIKLHETGYFSYNSNILLSDIKVNASTTRTIYLAGNAVDNSCNTGTFSDRYGSYNAVIVQGIFSITLMSYRAKFQTESRKLVLATGLLCDYDQMSCLDSLNGLTIWERINNRDCMSDKLELIYEGNITQITETTNNETKITYIVDENTYLFILENRGYTDVCYQKFTRTQSAETYVLTNRNNFLKARHVTVDYNKYFDNKITIIYKTLEGEIKDIYIQNTKRTCENELSIIQKNLDIAHINPDLFAFDLMGPGYTAQLAGNVIHIIKCQPVEVNIVQNPKYCTQEIPIRYHDQLLYMTSDSKLLIRKSRKIRCNKILPVKFRINGIWIKFTPTLKYTNPPRKIGPRPRENFKQTEIRDIEGRGLYSKEDMDDYTNSINFPIERKIILDNTATDIHKIQEEENIDPDTNFFTALVERKINKYWTEFKDFGAISAAICASITIIMIIGYIINVLINALQIKNIVGCSIGLGAALLSSTTNKLIRKSDRKNKDENVNKEEELESSSESSESPNIIISQTPNPETEMPIPKPRKPIVKYLSPRMVSRKIQTSFRRLSKKSTETQAHATNEND